MNETTPQRYDYKINIIILGVHCVGKTRLILRFVENKFTDSYLPTIERKV